MKDEDSAFYRYENSDITFSYSCLEKILGTLVILKLLEYWYPGNVNFYDWDILYKTARILGKY